MEQYLMDDLNAMSIPELQDIAAEMGIKMKKSSAEDKQSLIFEIIDKQAENAGQASQEKPRARRSRISDTPTGSRVYTANSDGKAKSQAPAPAAEADGAASVAPRKRGRPSKAELQARAEKLEQLEVAPIFNNGTAPEEETEAAKASDNFDEDLPAFLTEELKKSSEAPESEETERKAEQTPVKTDSIKQELEATRGEEITDTDFVIVQDLPIVPVSSMPVFMDEPSPMQESVGRPKFRRFKDDPLLADGGVSVAGAPAATSASAQPQRAVPYVPQTLLKGSGVLELMPDGFGFLRSAEYNYLTSPDDIFVTPNHIRSLGLKVGDVVEGTVKIPREGEKYFTLVDVELVNGLTPAEIRDRVAFEHLTPLFPEEKFSLCSGRGDSLSRRIVDLFAPIGKGQRALIVAQPKTGKTMLMKDIANAIAQNHPDTYLMMLLIDERPEEVTDMARTVKAEVIASTFDEPAAHHVKIAGLVLEKAKRMVECGHDVVIFLDSITRLARAYNTVAPTSGKVLTGGVDANALQKPKRFFGAARNIEGGGSLTIIATALIDTGSKMDEVIFEEFKGTGNMELQLERVLSNKRIFPAVNLVASSTRRDDLLLDPQTVGRMHILRNYISEMNPLEAITDVRRRMEATRTNEEFIMSMNS